MQRHNATRIQRESCALAAAFLIAFCLVGFASVRFRPMYQGFDDSLPMATRFSLDYGAIVFPLLGIAAVASFILSDLFFSNRWRNWVLLAVFGLLFICAFITLLMPSGIGGMRSHIHADAARFPKPVGLAYL
jgi:hypothetical protein